MVIRSVRSLLLCHSAWEFTPASIAVKPGRVAARRADHRATARRSGMSHSSIFMEEFEVFVDGVRLDLKRTHPDSVFQCQLREPLAINEDYW